MSESPHRATIEAVVFDWGGTITPWHAIDLHAQWLAYTQVYDQQRASELADQLVTAESAAWIAHRDDQLSACLDDVFRGAGIEPSGDRHDLALAEYEAGWDPHTLADPEALPLFEALRGRGLRIGILSNTLWSRRYHEQIFARDGLLDLIDGAVYSSEIARTKPHADAFYAALAAVGLTDPAQAVFVGDRPFDDIHGARSVGMRAVLIPHSEIPAEQRGHTDGEPHAVVRSLSELTMHLDEWLAY